MSGFPKLKSVNHYTFPSNIRMPDVAGYTGRFFNVKRNPHRSEAEAGSYAWFNNYGIHTHHEHQELSNTSFGQLASWVYADADLEHLWPAMDFVQWLFAFDDMIDKGGLCDDINGIKLAVDVTMNVLRNPDTAQPKFKIAVSLLSVFNRMCANSSPATLKHFVNASDVYTQAILQQDLNRSINDTPTVEWFIEHRRDTSPVKMVFSVLEYSPGLSLPDEVHNDPIIVELMHTGNDIPTWVNDMYSFPMQAWGDTQNLIFTTMWDKELNLEGVIDYVYRLTCRHVQEYFEVKKQLRSFGPELDPQVALYVQGIKYCVQGFMDWMFMTPREHRNLPTDSLPTS